MGVFPCDGADTFLSVPFGEEELGAKEREGRQIKLEEMDWRGESKAPWAVWLTDEGEKPGQGQRKAVVVGLRAFWGAPGGAEQG